MKKLLIVMFLVILLAGTVSAAEWDNVKKYNPETKTVTIKNSILRIIPTSEIATIQLKTPIDYQVPRGYQKVAEFELESFVDYENALQEIDFYDARKDLKKIDRQFDFKYKTIEEVVIPDYVEDCKLPRTKDGFCQWIESGSHIESQEKWHDLESLSVAKDQVITIGIFTDVQKGDYVEWIPSFYGERVKEWATFTENLFVGLVSWYRFEGLAGDVVDFQGNQSGINEGATRGVEGIIGNGFQFDGVGDYINISTSLIAGDTSVTVSCWVNATSSAGDDGFFTINSDGGGSSSGFAAATHDGNYEIVVEGVAFGSTGIGINTNAWSNLVATRNGNDYELYVNNTLGSAGTIGGGTFGSVNLLAARSAPGITFFFGGLIDECGIWDRVLNSTEISDLFNDGAGISPVNFPVVTLNTPIDNFNSSSQTIDFNGSISSIAAIANVSLIIDNSYNQTNSSGTNDANYLFQSTLADGIYTWKYESCNINNGCTNSSGRTFTIDSTNPLINITRPLSTQGVLKVGSPINLNWTLVEANPDTCFFDYNFINTTVSCTTNTTFNYVSDINNVTVWANDTFGGINFTFREFNVTLMENVETFNPFTFESKTETLTINITTNGSTLSDATLFYGGVSSGSGDITSTGNDNFDITTTQDTPLGVGNNSWFYEINFLGERINSTENQQSVGDIVLGVCNSSLSIPYLNFTFKNETTNQEDVTASITNSIWTYTLGTGAVNKTFNYANSTESFNYTFCFSPPNQTLSTTLDIAYTNTLSQQRTFTPTLLTLSNLTTQQTLYLLPNILGLFTQFATQDTLGNTLAAVKAVITRTLGGSTISVTSDETDGSGLVVFFLDPDVTYTATFSLSGFANNIFAFVPITDLRTVIMGSIVSVVVNGSTISLGTSYDIEPSNSSLQNNTVITFSFNVTTAQTVSLISLNITNSTNQRLFVSNTGQGFISGTLNTNNDTRLFGEFIIVTTNETIVIKKVWIIGQDFTGDYSIKRQMTLFNDYGFNEFIKFLLIIFSIGGVMIFLSRDNQLEDEVKMAVLIIMVWIFSVVGWLDTGIVVSTSSSNINSLTQFGSQYGIAILSTITAAYFILRRIFRQIG